jgi:YHS domain-containing protein
MQVHDEVCGMTIEAEAAAASIEFQGKTYHFCSERCKQMFEEHPDRYVPAPDSSHS